MPVLNALVTQAKNTIAAYKTIILKWQKFCLIEGFPDCPAQAKHLCEFISQLALNKAPLSTFSKLSPALVFFHDANRVKKASVMEDPFVKLVLEGAKREAAERKPTTKKAPTLSQSEVHHLIDQTIWRNGPGKIGPNPDLIVWRTVVCLFVCYKTFCRFSCYQQLTSKDIEIFENHISVEFKHAKNDQFYNGTFSLLAALDGSPYCPKLIVSSYFQVMGFSRMQTEYLNCRILNSKNNSRAKPGERLCYSNSNKDNKNVLHSVGLTKKYSEKSFKVAGVSHAIDKNVPLLDIQSHGRWKSLEVPLIYTKKSEKCCLEVSKVVV